MLLRKNLQLSVIVDNSSSFIFLKTCKKCYKMKLIVVLQCILIRSSNIQTNIL